MVILLAGAVHFSECIGRVARHWYAVSLLEESDSGRGGIRAAKRITPGLREVREFRIVNFLCRTSGLLIVGILGCARLCSWCRDLVGYTVMDWYVMRALPVCGKGRSLWRIQSLFTTRWAADVNNLGSV